MVITDGSGQTVRTMYGPANYGLNRAVWNLRYDGPKRLNFLTPPSPEEETNLFFDPDFDAPVQRVPGAAGGADDSARRWDGANLQAFEGRYGDYVTYDPPFSPTTALLWLLPVLLLGAGVWIARVSFKRGSAPSPRCRCFCR